MEMFINIIQVISDNRFWLMPLVLGCVVVVLAVAVFRIVQDEIRDWTEY